MEYLVKKIDINKDYVNITLKDEVGCTYKHKIHAVAFANNYFNVGNSFDNDYLNNLLNESDYYNIKDSIIKKLKVKDYSKSEIKEMLIDKLNDYDINKLIIDLERNNYINDYNYVKRIFNDAETKLKGKLYIEDKLKNKEIDDKITMSFFSNLDEKHLASKLINIEYKKLKDKYPKNTIINKISYKLNYNGFSEFVIYEEIEKLEYIKGSNDLDLIKKDYSKLLKKYQNRFKNKELENKIIESLLVKGYNYKSIKNVVEGMKNDD